MNPTERIDGSIIPAQPDGQATERIAESQVTTAQFAATERIAAPFVGDGGVPSAVGVGIGSRITLGTTTCQIQHLLARSGEAEVYLVDIQGQKRVWKLYHQDFKPKQEIVDSLKGMKHTNIMALLETGEYNGRFYELNEYLLGGTLDELKPFTNADRLREVIRQVNEALHLCHQQRIIHRDIKPQNIFFRDTARTEVVLGDFGISSQLDAGASSRVTTRARTSLYAAPELFTEIKGKTTLGVEVDYYALGVTILEVWDGQNPFGTDLEHNMMRAKTGARFLMPAGMPASFNSLVKGLLTPNYEDRWGYAQVAAWTRGEPNIPLKFAALFDYKPYLVGKKLGLAEDSAIESPQAMGVFIEKHKKIGIELLYGNKISQWLYAAGDSEKADQITDVVEKDYPKDQQAGLMEAVFILNPERPLKGHDGSTLLNDFAEMAVYFEQHALHYQKALLLFTDEFYAFLMALDVLSDEDEITGKVVTTDYKAKAKTYHALFQNHDYTPAKALNTIILDLQQGELKLGTTQTRFTHFEEFVSVNHPDLQKYVIDQFADADSKAVIWLETYHPAVAKQVMFWRKAGRHSPLTLGYALGLHGYRIGQQQAKTVEQFLEILASQPESYFTTPDAAYNREEADYWLKEYAQSSLARVLVQAIKQRQLPPNHLNESIRYIFDRHTEVAADPYLCADEVLRAAEPTFDPNDPQLASELTARLTDFYTGQISDTTVPQKAATHLDHYQKLTRHLVGLPDTYQAVMKTVMSQLSATIEGGVHQDFMNLAKSDKHFLAYSNQADQFIGQQLAQHFPELPLLANWQKRQQLLTAKTSGLLNKLQAEKRTELAENQKTFEPAFKQARKLTKVALEEELARASHNGDVNKFYHSKGITFLLIMGGLSLINFIFLGFWVIIAWDYLPVQIKPTYLIRKVGRWAYKPVVDGGVAEIITLDVDTPYQRTLQGFNANISQIEDHFAALEEQETLIAKRDVFLLDPVKL